MPSRVTSFWLCPNHINARQGVKTILGGDYHECEYGNPSKCPLRCPKPEPDMLVQALSTVYGIGTDHCYGHHAKSGAEVKREIVAALRALEAEKEEND